MKVDSVLCLSALANMLPWKPEAAQTLESGKE